MAKQNTSNRSGGFVDQVVKDPNNPPNALLLQGYLGASSEENHVRLYLDPQLSDYVEIPEDAILHTVDAPAEQSPLGGSYVWINADAQLTHGKAGPAEGQVFGRPNPATISGRGRRTGGRASARVSPAVLRDTDSMLPADRTAALFRHPYGLMHYHTAGRPLLRRLHAVLSRPADGPAALFRYSHAVLSADGSDSLLWHSHGLLPDNGTGALLRYPHGLLPADGADSMFGYPHGLLPADRAASLFRHPYGVLPANCTAPVFGHSHRMLSADGAAAMLRHSHRMLPADGAAALFGYTHAVLSANGATAVLGYSHGVLSADGATTVFRHPHRLLPAGLAAG